MEGDQMRKVMNSMYIQTMNLSLWKTFGEGEYQLKINDKFCSSRQCLFIR